MLKNAWKDFQAGGQQRAKKGGKEEPITRQKGAAGGKGKNL